MTKGHMTKGQAFYDALVRSKPSDSFPNAAICRDPREQFVGTLEPNQTGSWSAKRQHTTLQIDDQ
jgi:hypothetical protein